MSNVANLVPTKSDAEFAKEYRERVIELWKPIIELLNEADKNGFKLNVGCGPTPMGFQILQLEILKSF